VQIDGPRHRLQPVVLDSELLVAGPVPQELLQREMERSERNAHLTVLHHVEVREGDGQLIVLIAHRRAEEEGRPSRSNPKRDKWRVP